MYIGGWGGESNREIDFGFVFRVRDRVVRCEAVRDDIWYARGSETFSPPPATAPGGRRRLSGGPGGSSASWLPKNKEKHMVV